MYLAGRDIPSSLLFPSLQAMLTEPCQRCPGPPVTLSRAPCSPRGLVIATPTSPSAGLPPPPGTVASPASCPSLMAATADRGPTSPTSQTGPPSPSTTRALRGEVSRVFTPATPARPQLRCPGLSHQAGHPVLPQLVGRCFLLHYLDISGCSLVSSLVSSQQPHHSRGLREPLSHGLALTHLDLTDCTRLDDQSLRLILEAAHSIEFLYVRRSSNLTGEFSNKLTIVSPRYI